MPSIGEFNTHTSKHGNTSASRLLFSWLCNDSMREQLYQDMSMKKVVLAFESRAAEGNDDPVANPKNFRQTAYLMVAKEHLYQAYTQSANVPPQSLLFSNTPFEGLGGTFMLAIDEPTGECPAFRSHDAQRTYSFDHLKALDPYFSAVATVAFKAGALVPLKSRNFDLASLAEMVAVHYVALLFGFSQSDLQMLQSTSKKIGKGLQYQMMARHFVTEPLVMLEAKQALGQIVQRCAQLIDVYGGAIGTEQVDLLTDMDEELRKLKNYFFENPAGVAQTKIQLLQNFQPMMRRMAIENSIFSTTEKSILVAGLVGGAITNIKASICIAVQQFFNLKEADLTTVHDEAIQAWLLHRDASWITTQTNHFTPAEKFRAYVEEAMRVNPPAAFTPRRAHQDISLCNIAIGGSILTNAAIEKDALIVLGVGGGAWTIADNKINLLSGQFPPPTRFDANVDPSKPVTTAEGACPFSNVFGGPPELNHKNERAAYTHSCIGKDLAMHVITYAVRQMMVLPGLTQGLDEKTAAPLGLTKKWGYSCESYPLEYHREKLLRQSPLQTVLYVKNPVSEHAEALKRVIQYGAPLIDKVLQDARHLHFASFIFLDNDSKLVLFTAYDGDFDAYIGHFAREFGPLFDRFFSHIEGGPPTPIEEHPFEFVQFLRQYQKPSVGGYFFSAYPEVTADQIKHHFNRNRKYDFDYLESGR